MASPPPYSSQPTEREDQPIRGDIRSIPRRPITSAPSDATPSSIASEATLPGYSSPIASEARRTGSLRKTDSKRSSIGSSLASTEAVRRLRDAEEEVRRLRELNQRLRAEGAVASSLSPTRIRQLREDAKASSADLSGRKANSGLFKSVCSTDLLFLIDTTASMTSHIAAAKEQVKSIVNDINFAFLGEAEVRIAVVGYKDHQDTPNIEYLDFTTDVNRVRSFIDSLRATGGGDTPEDMLGGINQALNATWKNQTRCIIHIADAPPHGRVSHDLGDSADRYATPGTEPHKLHYQPLITQMVSLNINYALLRINNYTDRMALNFLKVYLAAGSECTLFRLNKYFSMANDLISGASLSYLSSNSSFRSSKAKLQFEETELGTSYEKLRHMVVRNVTSSASRTAVRMSSGSGPRKPKFESKLASTGMGAIQEDEDDDKPSEVKLETVVPEWNKPGWLNETLMLEGFSPDVGVHGASTLNDMMEDDENIKMSITELTIKKRSKPFAQGAMRVAAYAMTKDSTNHFVVKSFKKDKKKLAHLAEDMRCQALCKAFALEYSALVGEEESLDFIVTTCLRGKRRGAAREEHLSLEPLIAGSYVKFNNNTNWVNKELENDPICQSAQAFSHFTFERSKGQFLVSDLQGVGRLLTDPAIHTREADRFKLSDTNLNREGFKFFFSAHECNDICKKLKLQSSRQMFVDGTFTYREDWPTMDNVVCCSNKLCGKILQLTHSKTHKDFEGHHWCNQCYPQLDHTMITLLCVASGDHHEFRASRFFYESQGRNPPRLCAEHREDDSALFRSEFNASTAVITNTYRSMPGAFISEGSERASSNCSDGFPPIVLTPDAGSVSSSASTLAVPKPTVLHPADPEPECIRGDLRVPKPTIPNPIADECRANISAWAAEAEASLDDVVEASAEATPATMPYTPYISASVAKTKKRHENFAAASRLSLASTGGGFWSKLKKRSLQFKPSSGILRKKDS